MHRVIKKFKHSVLNIVSSSSSAGVWQWPYTWLTQIQVFNLFM